MWNVLTESGVPLQSVECPYREWGVLTECGSACPVYGSVLTECGSDLTDVGVSLPPVKIPGGTGGHVFSSNYLERRHRLLNIVWECPCRVSLQGVECPYKVWRSPFRVGECPSRVWSVLTD